LLIENDVSIFDFHAFPPVAIVLDTHDLFGPILRPQTFCELLVFHYGSTSAVFPIPGFLVCLISMVALRVCRPSDEVTSGCWDPVSMSAFSDSLVLPPSPASGFLGLMREVAFLLLIECSPRAPALSTSSITRSFVG